MRSKTGHVAIVVKETKGSTTLVEHFSDDQEIALLQAAFDAGEKDPLGLIYQLRAKQKIEDEEFGNYVEELLSQPFLKKEIVEHGVQWLKSKMRIEDYQRSEIEATRIIAQYAHKLYEDDKARNDYILSGPSAKVRIRVFVVKEVDQTSSNSSGNSSNRRVA